MRITKLLYVFSFTFILFFTLCPTGFAQKSNPLKKVQKGLASWYGTHFHGQKTASDEVYNKNHLTAAHLSLPFGTKVKVTNKHTRKSVIVRINDRGPFGHKERIIDLSEAAARKIDVYAEGAAEVVVEIISASSARIKFKARKEAKAIAKAPVAKPEPEQAQPRIPLFMAQVNPFTRPANNLLLAEIAETQDIRQPLALKEEEMNGFWMHEVAVFTRMSRSQPVENRFRYSEAEHVSLVKIMPGAS